MTDVHREEEAFFKTRMNEAAFLTLKKLREFRASHPHSKTNRGPRVLITGQPEVGKKRAARWVAQGNGQSLVRVDIPAWVSSYIGETEKNLRASLQWSPLAMPVLLFDEADALFGKLDEAPDSASHDKYANQEVSYLRQLFEAYPGLLLVTTRQKPRPLALWSCAFDKVVSFLPAT